MAAPTAYTEFVDQILFPTNLDTFQSPVRLEQIEVQVYRNAAEPTQVSETIVIEDLYPFNTVYDLMTKIFIEKDRDEAFHPQNQCLLVPDLPGRFTQLRFLFSTASSPQLTFPSPFTVLRGKPDERFVDLQGNTKTVEIVNHEQFLLETLPLFSKQRESYVLHLVLYGDMLRAYTGIVPINAVDWEGKFRPFFPALPRESQDGSLAPAVAAYADTLADRLTKRLELINVLDPLLEDELRSPELTMYRNLRIGWRNSKNLSSPASGYQPFRVESIFYDMPVSPMVPYIRFYPRLSKPMSKLYVDGPLKIPILDRRTVLKWIQEKSLSPTDDMLMMKVLLRPESGSIKPVYGTFFIFADASAKLVLQPNEDEKGLTRQSDLDNLAELLQTLTEQIPKLQPRASSRGLAAKALFTAENCFVEDASAVFALTLERDDPRPITKKSLNAVLKYFHPFFQVTSSPIKDQNPISFLRFKLVNDFRIASRDWQFLYRVLDLEKLVGAPQATILTRLKEHYMEQYDVPDEVAAKRVLEFSRDVSKYDAVSPERLDYVKSDNPGIDIAIFGQHPYYTFHLYRVPSLFTLRRLKSFLALLLTRTPEDFEDFGGAAEDEAVAEEEEQEEADGEEHDEAPVATQVAMTEAEAEEAPAMELEGEFALNGIDFEGFGLEEAPPAAPAAAAKPLKTLAAVEEAVKPAAAAAAARAPPKHEEEEEEEEKGFDSSNFSATYYFSNRLSRYDKKLFKLPKEYKQAKKFTTVCQANALRQPIVMSEEEFARMKGEYAEDIEEGRVFFIEYPLKAGTSKPKPENKSAEVITTLRYGSNLLPGKANIYICSLYWCVKDEIVVLKDDFEGTEDRKGRPKPPFTCPFCRGTLVTKAKGEGQTVIERKAHEKRQLFVGFASKSDHPLNLFYPCCFLKDEKDPKDKKKEGIYDDLEPFEPLQKALRAAAPAPAAAAAQAPAPQAKGALKKVIVMDIASRLETFTSAYITGAEKLPLELTKEGPQVGIVPKPIDTYFSQTSVPDLVKLDHTVWKVMTDNRTGRPNASGFFRVAVDNRASFLADALLSAIAPYYGLPSAQTLKARMLDIIRPSVFLSLNYGNLLFDFYDPMDKDPTGNALSLFEESGNLSGGLGDSEVVKRAAKAYSEFQRFLKSTNAEATKEFRHFAHFFSQPLLTRFDADGALIARGICFIVLEVSAQNEVTVRCPPYGVSPDMAENCDFAFLLHFYTGAWEPLFYAKNNAAEKVEETHLLFRQEDREEWPAIVKQRVDEYIRMCHSSGLGIYTYLDKINNETLIPLSVALAFPEENPSVTVYAVLRDLYNHVSAVLYSAGDKVIYLPVIDDGTVSIDVRQELDWIELVDKYANRSRTLTFFNTVVPQMIAMLPREKQEKVRPMYQIIGTLQLDHTLAADTMSVLHLAGGMFVPYNNQGKDERGVKGFKLESDGIEERRGQEYPWSIDRTILGFGEQRASREVKIDYKEFHEIYEHLRYTFANWFALADGDTKKSINAILFKDGVMNPDLPVFAKRRRLEQRLGKMIQDWMEYGKGPREIRKTLKRVDCRVIREESECSNRCVWKDETETCHLHTPERMLVGSEQVDVKGLLMRRLLEELIRFPDRREELLKQGVRQYVTLSEPFVQGHEYIAREDMPGWSELLRGDWQKKRRGEALNPDELVAIHPLLADEAPAEAAPAEAEAQEEAAPAPAPAPAPAAAEVKTEEATLTTPLPPMLKGIFKKARQALFFMEVTSLKEALEFLGLDPDDIEAYGIEEEDEVFTSLTLAKAIAQELEASIYQLEYEEDNPITPDILAVKALADETIAPVFIYTKLPDGTLGVVTSSPEQIEFIDYTSLPQDIRKIMKAAPVEEIL